MKASLSMCFLFVLVYSDVSNRCYKFFYNRMGVPEVCRDEQDSCISSFTVNGLDSADDDTEDTFLWGCTTNCTPGDYSFTTLKDKYFHRRTLCCQDHYCNNQTIPELYLPQNGLECPGCSSSSFEDCRDSETVMCRGEETQCIEFVMANYGSNHSYKVFKGCATQNFCTLARTSEDDDFFGNINQAQCCDTKAPPKHNQNSSTLMSD